MHKNKKCKKCNNPFVVKVNSCNLLLCSQCKEEEKNILKNINLQNKLNLQETVKLQTEYINCSVCGEKFIKLKTSNRKTCSKECRCKIFSETAKRTKLGGNHNRFSLWYESKIAGKVFLESSYELKVAQELDRNNINWIRPKSFSYVTEDNKNHLYYPDFYLIDYKVYLDPKNSYLIEKDKIKISTVSQQNNIKVLVLTKEQLTWRTIKCLI